MSDNKPAKKFRIGYVTATIWKNDNFYSVTLERSYKEGDEYKSTNGLSHADLLNAARVLTRAEAWIAEQ